MSGSALINVTTRIPPEHKAELARRAGDAGISSYLAQVVRDHLEGGSEQAVLDTVTELRDQVAEDRADLADLRNDLATVLEIVLLNLAGTSPEDVQQFVSANLRKAGNGSGRG
ncbi:MAG: hypothetical protein RLN60_04030 [Phycisphaerales bacterium]